MTPVFTAMKAFLRHRWGLPSTPEERAALDAQRGQERDLADGARTSGARMDALIAAVADGTVSMRPMAMGGMGAMSPLGLSVSTWIESCESRFHTLRVETLTNGHENFLSTVYLNGITLKRDDPATERLSLTMRAASGAPARDSGLNVGLDPATTRPRRRR